MNLALPALVILLGLLPGITCFYGYFAGRFDKRTAGVSAVEELALYVIFAIPIDVAALWVCRRVGLEFNWGVATHMLTGGTSDVPIHTEIATFFEQSTGITAFTYMVILATAFVIGSCCRRFVWACRFDTWIPHLRIKHGWFYILQGRHENLPRRVLAHVDVLTLLPGEGDAKTRLYRGVVLDFEIAATGGLESLTITNAERGSGRGDQFQWKEIPSSRFLLMGSTIHSVNVRYVEIDDPQDWRSRLGAWYRSFTKQEP